MRPFTRVFHTSMPVHHLEFSKTLANKPAIIVGMYMSFIPFYVNLVDKRSKTLVGRCEAELRHDAMRRMIEAYSLKYSYMPIDSDAEQSVISHHEAAEKWNLYDTRTAHQGKVIIPGRVVREGDMLLFSLMSDPHESTLM